MRRRDFITLVGGAVAPSMLQAVATYAQQPAMPVIGFLYGGSETGGADNLQAFRQGLEETGYVEGRNVAIEYCWAEGRPDRLPAMAADLVGRRVAVIVASGTTASLRAAIAATSTIPIVFTSAGDPVAEGFVASLNRPGGNRTGVTSFTVELLPKRLELLHEAAPKVTSVSVLINPLGTSVAGPAKELQEAARKLGLQLNVVRASSEREVDTVLASLSQKPTALMIPPDALFLDLRAQLGALTLRHAIPAVHSYREFAAAGGLMSYGGSRTEAGHLLGVYTGRILKGEKPADLPVQQATKVELIVNLRTARALGLSVPLPLLARADEVIE